MLKNKRYRLRLEFTGSRITLFENDVQQLIDVDETDQLGQFGLRTWNTRAPFENVRAIKARPRAFLVMPFRSEFDFVHTGIQDSMIRFCIDCVRADQIAISRPVMEDVKTSKNPNVYYEAGLADAMGKDWIILAQSPDDLAFDVRHIRCVLYSNVMGADQKLINDIENALGALGYSKSLLFQTQSQRMYRRRRGPEPLLGNRTFHSDVALCDSCPHTRYWFLRKIRKPQASSASDGSVDGRGASTPGVTSVKPAAAASTSPRNGWFEKLIATRNSSPPPLRRYVTMRASSELRSHSVSPCSRAGCARRSAIMLA